MKTIQSNPTKQQGAGITPFLWFDGKVQEAVNFYTSIFKNSKVLRLIPLPGDVPGRKGDKVLLAEIELDGQKFILLDGGPLYKFTHAISFVVKCTTQQEVDEFWEKLSEGGKKESCGWVIDKYGLSWQITPDTLSKLMYGNDPVKSKRVMDAMLQMDKIEIKKLQDAYDKE